MCLMFGFFGRFLLRFVVFVIVLFVSATTVLPYFIPVEKIVPIKKVNDILGEQAGLKLALNGKTRISILPFVGFSAKNFSITNIKDDFKNDRNVISASKIDIKLSVLPLILGNVVVKNILIDGANINIVKCKDVVNVFSPINSTEKIEVKNSTTESIDIQDYIKSFGIKNFSIKNSNLTYKECETDTKYEIKGFDASIFLPSFEEDLSATFGMAINDVRTDVDINSSNLKDILEKKIGNLKIDVRGGFGNANIEFDYSFNEKFQTFFDNTTFKINAKEIMFSKILQMASVKNENLANLPKINFAINGRINNTKALLENLNFKMGEIAIFGKKISASVPNRVNPETISTKGEINIVAKNIQKLAKSVNMEMDIIKKYPSKIEGVFAFSFLNNIFKLQEKSNIKIDDTVKVNISAIANTIKGVKSVVFGISSDVINVDEYLNLQKKDVEKTKESTESKNTQHVSIAQKLSKEKITIPKIKNIIVDGNISIKKLTAYEMNIENISSKLRIRNGLIANDLYANLLNGSANIGFEIKEKNNILAGLKLNIELKKFEIEKIIDIAGIKQIAKGKINAIVDFKSHASNIHDIVMQGDGIANFDAENFTIIGIDFNAFAKDVREDYKAILSSNAFAKYISEEKSTVVEDIVVKNSISNGVVQNSMLAKKERISLEGGGKIDLKDEKIYYKVTPKNGGNFLPALVVKRTINDPFYTIDPTLYVKQQAKKALTKEIKTNPKIQEKLEKLNDVINNFKL